MKTVLLGTGTPNAEPNRSGPSVAVIAEGEPYVVDCGPGVVRRACAAFRKGIRELKPKNLRNLFLTHLHSDHTAGLPDFILTPWVLEREEPLVLWGPPGTERMAGLVIDAYRQDIEERLHGLEPANRTGWQVRTVELSSGKVLKNGDLCVECFHTNHGGLSSLGYRFLSKGKSVVISGDTAPFEGIENYYGNCDVLIHEVYSQKGWERRSDPWKRYHRSVHTSATELAELACRVKPGLLVLYHQLLHGVGEEELLGEIKSLYDGDVIYGRDLDTF